LRGRKPRPLVEKKSPEKKLLPNHKKERAFVKGKKKKRILFLFSRGYFPPGSGRGKGGGRGKKGIDTLTFSQDPFSVRREAKRVKRGCFITCKEPRGISSR